MKRILAFGFLFLLLLSASVAPAAVTEWGWLTFDAAHNRTSIQVASLGEVGYMEFDSRTSRTKVFLDPALIGGTGTPGSGDVVGPSSTTDNAVARYSLATGKLIKSSLMTIDDSGSPNIPAGQTYNISGAAHNHEVTGLTSWPAGLTATELGYVDGVTSGIQAQLNLKANVSHLGYIQLTHPHRFGAAAPVQTDTTLSTNGRGLHAKDTDKATNFVDYWFIVPPDLDTTVALKVAFMAFETAAIMANASTVHWILSTVSIAESAAFNGVPATAIDCTYTAGAAIAANDTCIVSNVTLTGWAAALTPGQLMQVRLERDGDTADTADAATYSPIICLSYGKVQ